MPYTADTPASLSPTGEFNKDRVVAMGTHIDSFGDSVGSTYRYRVIIRLACLPEQIPVDNVVVLSPLVSRNMAHCS